MNDLAIELGYCGSTEKRTLASKNIERIAHEIEIVRKSLIEKIDENNKDEIENISKAIDELVSKYKTKIASGEYSIITNDTLLIIGNGTIVDEKCGAIVWTADSYLKWDDMSEI